MRPSRTFLSLPICCSSAAGVKRRALPIWLIAIGRPTASIMPAHARHRFGRAEAELGREIESEPHAQRHRLAMQQRVAEAGLGFERMAEGVAEIQERALAGLALVDRDDSGLGGAALQHRLAPRIGIAGDELRPRLLQPFEEGAVADEPVFHHLGIAGEQLAPRQGGERVDIGQHQHRLMKGADQVLAVLAVDRGLAADRAVDLRQQRGRHLHVIEAAQQGRGGKAGEIADDAAAQRDERRAALDAERQHVLAQLREMREILGLPRRAAGRSRDARSSPCRARPRSRLRCSFATVASVTMTARFWRTTGAISAPASPKRPAPTTMS